MMTRTVGQSVRRADGDLKARGAAIYGMDYSEPFMLHAKLLRAPVAAGRISNLDTTRARQMPGVRAIVTAADAPSRSGWVIKDQPLMVRDVIRHFGEPIAAVAADTEQQAVAAVAAITFDLETTDPIATLDQAMAPEATVLHPDWHQYAVDAGGLEKEALRGGNIAWKTTLRQGDADNAFLTAHHVFEGSYEVPRQHQSPIEPHCAVARFEQGRYVIHTPTQYPFLVRDRVAEFLGVRSSSVQIVATWVGGAFGGKLDALLEPYCALLAAKTGRPVRLLNTRAEELQTANPRENATVWLQTAVDADGRILGQRARCRMDCGAYAGETVALASAPAMIFGGTYLVPHADYETVAVYTNTTPTAAFRGVCGPYCVWALEQHMDQIAAGLGISPRELRLRNILHKDDPLVNGQRVPDDGLQAAFDAVEGLARSVERSSANPNVLRGIGISAMTWVTNSGPGHATLKLNEDGTIALITGAVEIGSGSVAASLRQITAEELGVDVEDVFASMADTDSAGYDAGAQGSRTTFGVGNSVVAAASDLRAKVFAAAADLLEVSPTDLALNNGEVGVIGAPDAKVTLAEVARHETWARGPIVSEGKYNLRPMPHAVTCTLGSLEATYFGLTYHVHQAEVEVDPDTGLVTVTRYVVAQDVGRAINPQGIRSQVQGGVVQGIGYALYEDLRAVDGITLDRSLETYRLPTVFDAPRVELSLLELACDDGPYGAKGAAEPAIVPVAAAIASAVADAIGRPVGALPMTPWRVLEALDHDVTVDQ